MSQIEPQSSEEVPPLALKNPKMKWWQKTLVGLAIAITVAGLLVRIVPSLVFYAEMSTPPDTVTPPQAAAGEMSMEQIIRRLDYESMGRVVRVEKAKSHEAQTVFMEGDLEDFAKLKNRIVDLSSDDPRLVDQCNGDETRIACGEELKIFAIIDQNRILLQIENQMGRESADDSITRDRSLRSGIAIVNSKLSYYPANARDDDKCRWDEGSDGSFSEWKSCARFSVILDERRVAKMTLEVKDIGGTIYTFHKSQPVIDPKYVERLAEYFS